LLMESGTARKICSALHLTWTELLACEVFECLRIRPFDLPIRLADSTTLRQLEVMKS
jgi:hypothetical protein